MCIFCSIANHEIPSYLVYEDDDVYAFLDVNPVSLGHTLVIPKHHADNFLDCDPALMTHVFEVAQQLGQHIMATMNAKGMNILSNIGEQAGQSVKHFHVHLIPRYDDSDGITLQFTPKEAVDFNAVLSQIKGTPTVN